MKKIILIICFMLMCKIVFAQSHSATLPDSLSHCLKQEKRQDIQRVLALAKVCDYYFQKEQYAESQSFVNEIRELDSLLNDNMVKVVSHYYQGNLKLGENMLEDAMPHLLAAENGAAMLRENDMTLRLHIRTLISLGVCYFKCQLVPEAFQSFQRGLELNEKLNDNELNAMLKTDISQVYLNMNDTRKSLEINKDILSDTSIPMQRKSSPCISIVNLYITMQEYDSAYYYIDSANFYVNSIQEKIWIMMLKSNILRHTNHIDEAIVQQETALDSLAKYPNPELEVPLLINTARCFNLKGDYDKAMEHADRAVAVINSNPVLLQDVDVYKLKSSILEHQNRYREAMEMMKMYVRLNDSIMVANSLSHLYDLELQRNVKEVEEQAKIEQYAIKARYQRGWLIMAMALFILAGTVTVALLLLKRKNILLQNRQMNEKLLSNELDQRNRELAAKALAQAPEGKSLEDFDFYFVQTHPDFYNNLRVDFPNLTAYELRLCAYLKLNLSTKDIATICNINFDSARIARCRLRKALGITRSNESLVHFLSKY